MALATRSILGALVVLSAGLGSCEREAPSAPLAAPPVAAALPSVASMDEATLQKWTAKGLEAWQHRTCYLCHSLLGAPLVGPSPIGIWGSKQKLEDGREVLVDEAYIRESILDPAAAITAGYPNQMLSYRGYVTEEELTALAALFRALEKGPLPPAQPVRGTR